MDAKEILLSVEPMCAGGRGIDSGLNQVIFHAKSRRSAGAGFFVVGRDPAGMKVRA